MTATQLVLRFYKDLYTYDNGIINKRRFLLFRNEIKTNQLFKRKVYRKSEDPIGDYVLSMLRIKRKRSLNGLFSHITAYTANRSMLFYSFGWNEAAGKKILCDKWKSFIRKHVDCDAKKYLTESDLNFKWVETK